MTQNFVRYSPDFEQIEPDFERSLRWCEYFVMPSLLALRWIGNLAETSSIEQKEH